MSPGSEAQDAFSPCQVLTGAEAQVFRHRSLFLSSLWDSFCPREEQNREIVKCLVRCGGRKRTVHF